MENLARQSVVNAEAAGEGRPQVAAAEIVPALGTGAAAVGLPEQARWGISLGVVLLAYAAPLAWLAWPHERQQPNLPPPAAMVVELAPAPVAPPVEQAAQQLPPPPEPEPQPGLQPEPKLPVMEKPAAELPPAVREPRKKPEVKKPEHKKPEHKKPEHEKPEVNPQEPRKESPRKPEPAEQAEGRAAVADAAQPQPQAAAPQQGASAPVTDASQLANWQHSLMARLHHAKRYPRQSRRLHQEGVVYLRFTVNRAGNVLAASIERSAGFPLLDQETLELVRRAQPLPAFPTDIAQEQLEIVVPVEFFLDR